ncbi:MAG: NAD(P)-binding domain-containing protein [Stellaceae bacterium]
MSYAIIGFGKIGHALGKAFARKGIEVSVATTQDPKSFAADAAAIGPAIIPKTLGEAVKADTIFLAVHFESHPDVAKALPTWRRSRCQGARGRTYRFDWLGRARPRLSRGRRCDAAARRPSLRC